MQQQPRANSKLHMQDFIVRGIYSRLLLLFTHNIPFHSYSRLFGSMAETTQVRNYADLEAARDTGHPFRTIDASLNPAKPGAWAVQHHRLNLLSLQRVGNSNDGDIWVNFAELQRMRLRKLQIQLVDQAIKMHYDRTEVDDWENTLQKYSMFFFSSLFTSRQQAM
jgi:hypothetical protein